MRSSTTWHGFGRLFLIALVACVSPDGALSQSRSERVSVEAEARAFMKEYGEDLRHHRREALASRYSRRGVFFPSESSAPVSFEDNAALYRNSSQWKGPDTFEWRSLSYEVLGPDTVVVVGSFFWRQAPKLEATEFSYSNLLMRESGLLRIRVEHEAPKAKKQ